MRRRAGGAAIDPFDAELAYDRAGSGPPLVLLHPLGTDRKVWRPVRERLEAERDVITPDLPGFGASPPLVLADGRPEPALLAVAVCGLLHRLGLERPHLGGNSLGGWVALEAALRGDVASVTAIAPAGLWPRPLGPKPEVARKLARYGRPLLDGLCAFGLGRRVVLFGSMARPARVPPADARQIVRAYAQAPGFSAVNRAMRSGTFTRVGEIAVPVTLGWPEKDILVPRLDRVPRGVRSVGLPGCGHIPMWDDPDAVAQLLLEGSAVRAPLDPRTLPA